MTLTFSAMGRQRDTVEVTRHLGSILPIMDKGEGKIYFDQKVFLVSALFCFFVLTMTGSMDSAWMLLSLPLVFLRFLLVLGLGFFLWMGIIMINVELNCLIAARKNVKTLLAAESAR